MPLRLREMKGSKLTHAELDANFGIRRIPQAAHGFVAGDVVRETAADTFTKAQANSLANIGVGLGLVVHKINDNNFILLHHKAIQAVTLTAHGLGNWGDPFYLSSSVAGSLTGTESVLKLGMVIDANTILWSVEKVVLNPLWGIEKSADPPDPPEGVHVIWQSDGTGIGDDGDILMKVTAGGVTKAVTLIDFSVVP